MLSVDQTIDELLSKPHQWLVTGCAGFIGSHLTAFLLAHNQHVIGIDNLSSCGRMNLDDLSNSLPADVLENFTFHEEDIRNLDACAKAIDGGVDYVLHHAAIGSVKASFDDPETTHDVNVQGFHNIAKASLKCGAQKIVYASSSAVYGDNDVPKNNENQPLNPLSPYAQSKIDNELHAREMFDTHGLPLIGLRYFNIYGARQNPNGDYAAVIPKWIERGLNNQPAIIYGDGSAVRDFCHVDDIIRLNMLAIINGEGAQTYNGASGTSITIQGLQQLISGCLKSNQPPIYEQQRKGDIHTSIADTTKVRNDLNFCAQTDIRTGIENTIPFYTSLKKSSIS